MNNFSEFVKSLARLQNLQKFTGNGDLEFYFLEDGRIETFGMEFSSFEELEKQILEDVILNMRQETIDDWDDSDGVPCNPDAWIEDLPEEMQVWINNFKLSTESDITKT